MPTFLATGADIRKARKMRGLTLEALAERFDTTRQTISRWETGRARPRAEKAGRMAKWLAESAEESTSPGLRPERHAMISLSIDVPKRMLELAKDLDVELPTLLSEVGIAAVQTELLRIWREKSAEAIAHNNDYIEKNGLPLEHLKAW